MCERSGGGNGGRRRAPLRATLPLASLASATPALRSPGSTHPPAGKWKVVRSGEGGGHVMRRTASLDTIYLTGHWPSHSSLYLYNLQVDRSTQTDWESLGEGRKLQSRHQDQSSEEKLDKYMRHRKWTGGKESVRSEGAARHRMRSSIEGLNQEIEKLVLRSYSHAIPQAQPDNTRKCLTETTPEGHRAPVADLLRQTRSVNTQTPAPSSSSSAAVTSDPPSRESFSPLVTLDSRPSSEHHASGCSEDSSPEGEGRQLGTSPMINRFLTREPPDGCERVALKFIDEARKGVVDLGDYPLKPSMNFELKPSLGSAFHPPTTTSQTQPL